MLSSKSLFKALQGRKVQESVEVDCFIERPGCEWEYYVHVQTTSLTTLSEVLHVARRVLANDQETIPAQWIFASLAEVQLCGKGNDNEVLDPNKQLWEIKSSLAAKTDPVLKFSLSPHFQKQFVWYMLAYRYLICLPFYLPRVI